ncbi:GNAT family N-acetyltransferase [Hyalangium sp.]|uniref:GNAT family N-acetyltransferase n=1 Tax=Hyalangium sp. TaxID=2028555 RepID=UPI002D6769AC|nr:GNAT family N-acetyltransferase [Hyalangium sp.]HYH99590.1 GNAT family N-acetyltransferase [Hyalangium sp.]
MQTLESERLLFRPMTWEDLPFFIRLHGDLELVRYLGSGKPRTEQQTREWLERTLRWYAEDQVGHLAILLKASQQLLGRVGLTYYEIELPTDGSDPLTHWGRGSTPPGVPLVREIDLSCALEPGAWGQGYATEATRRLRDHAFQERGLERLISILHPENARALHVAEKLGFRARDRVRVYTQTFRRLELAREP